MRYILLSPWFDYFCLTVANGTRRLLPPWNPRRRRGQSVSCCSPFFGQTNGLSLQMLQVSSSPWLWLWVDVRRDLVDNCS